MKTSEQIAFKQKYATEHDIFDGKCSVIRSERDFFSPFVDEHARFFPTLKKQVLY